MKKIIVLLAIASANLLSLKAEDQVSTIEGDGIAKKWELRLDLGAESSMRKGYVFDHLTDGGALFELGVGYNFTSNWYAGLSSGYFYKAGESAVIEANESLPILANLTYRWNFAKKWSAFIDGKAGYLYSIKSDRAFSDGNSYEYPNAMFFNLMPGIIYRMLPNVDLKFSLGWGYFMTEDDEMRGDYIRSNNTMVAKIGMNFRKASKTEIRTTILEPADTVILHDTIYVPQPVTIVETTTPELKSLGEREVVIFYNIRKHNILPEKDNLLMEMALFTRTHKTSKIILKSYADKGTGNYQLNQMYSRNRMNEVRKHLIEKYGINPDQIESSYYGDTVQPFEENDKNRCSIITVKEIE